MIILKLLSDRAFLYNMPFVSCQKEFEGQESIVINSFLCSLDFLVLYYESMGHEIIYSIL